MNSTFSPAEEITELNIRTGHDRLIAVRLP
jgi:hypothetical protein